jgi:hypothetical protein
MYNHQAKRLGYKQKTFDEFLKYQQGRVRTKRKCTKSGLEATTQIRQSPKVESVLTNEYKPVKVERNTYTGDKLIGIAMMHKSNLVPVFKKEDAEDISRMRR